MAKNKMKKGDSKALKISHPNSRKAKALTKKIIKSSAREKTKMESALKRNVFAEKLMWFHDNLEPVEEYTPKMLDQLFQKYLKRYDEEVEQINIKHSIGQRRSRQHASREDIIKMTLKRDTEEYNSCGIELVDVLNKKQLKMFQQWDGELGFLNQFITRRFSKSHLNNSKEDQLMEVVEKDTKEVDDEKTDSIKEDVVNEGTNNVCKSEEIMMSH